MVFLTRFVFNVIGRFGKSKLLKTRGSDFGFDPPKLLKTGRPVTRVEGQHSGSPISSKVTKATCWAGASAFTVLIGDSPTP